MKTPRFSLTILSLDDKMVKMNSTRYIASDITDLCFAAKKMAFVSGPRQVSKTTMAKTLLSQREFGHYYNWDEITFRRQWAKDPC